MAGAWRVSGGGFLGGALLTATSTVPTLRFAGAALVWAALLVHTFRRRQVSVTNQVVK